MDRNKKTSTVLKLYNAIRIKSEPAIIRLTEKTDRDNKKKTFESSICGKCMENLWVPRILLVLGNQKNWHLMLNCAKVYGWNWMKTKKHNNRKSRIESWYVSVKQAHNISQVKVIRARTRSVYIQCMVVGAIRHKNKKQKLWGEEKQKKNANAL